MPRPFATRSAFAALMILAAMPLAAQRAETTRVEAASEVFQTLMGVPEYQVPAALMRGAQAIAIFPGVRRIGFVIGAQRGKGVLVVRGTAGPGGSPGAWSRPLFLTLRGASFGWQIGIQSADIVLFFRTKDSVERVLSGTYTLGVDASLAAGSLGRSASAVTDIDLVAEIYSYARTRGVFAGVALQGAALDVDDAATDAYYGKRGLRAEDVFAGTGLSTSPATTRLLKVIGGYVKALP